MPGEMAGNIGYGPFKITRPASLTEKTELLSLAAQKTSPLRTSAAKSALPAYLVVSSHGGVPAF